MTYRGPGQAFPGQGNAQQPQQQQQQQSYMSDASNNYQSYGQSAPQGYYQGGQQAYLAPQQLPQYGGYQGYVDGTGQAHGGNVGNGQQMSAQQQYVPPAGVWNPAQQEYAQQEMLMRQQMQKRQQQQVDQQRQQQMYQRDVNSPIQMQQGQHQNAHISPRPESMPQQQQQMGSYGLPQQQQQQQQQQQGQVTGQPQMQQQRQAQQMHNQYGQAQVQMQMQGQSQQPQQVQHLQPRLVQSRRPQTQTQIQAQAQAQDQARRQQNAQLPPLQHQPTQAQPIQQPQGHQSHVQQSPIQTPVQVPTQSSPAQQPMPKPRKQSQSRPQPPPPPPPVAQQQNYVNLQDIQQSPQTKPRNLGYVQSSQVPQISQDTIHVRPLHQETMTVNPADMMVNRPLPPQALQPQKIETPRVKPSPRSSVSNSPALSTRSPSITKRSPAISAKTRPFDTVSLMVAVAEECFEKARSAVHDAAMSSDATRAEYESLISTGLGCLEAAIQSDRLSPRQEARMRLRYAAVLREETENLMEAETALTKGVTICDKHRMFDLKYCMQYTMLKTLFQRNHKAALNAVDRHISDCEAFKHVHWLYAFRLLKASFQMEGGQATDASCLENIRSIQNIASSRGDNALSVFASILEGLTLLKTSKDGNIERVQTCIAHAAKFQFDPSVHILQLDMLTLLLDLASSINHQSPEITSQKLRLLQKKLDECGDWHNVKADFLLPIKKQPSTGQTLSEDTATIIQAGDSQGPSDFLVVSFMTKMELMSLVFTLSGLAHLHKQHSARRAADFWQEGLKILETWDKSTAGIPYGPSISLTEAVKQRAWRKEAQAYLNILLGLLNASRCEWDKVKQHVVELEGLVTRDPQSILRLLAFYLSGVYYQGIGDLPRSISIFQNPAFDLTQGGSGIKATHREMAILAALNRLWIMQHPAHRDNQETMNLLEQLQPLCSNHSNVDLRTAWHNVLAAIDTDPQQQLNQRKQHIQAAMSGSKSTSNLLGTAITLAIMRSRLFENIIGEQALKSALAASKQAQRAGNLLWQSVADGMLAQSYEVQGHQDEARQEWEKATREANEAFPSSS